MFEIERTLGETDAQSCRFCAGYSTGWMWAWGPTVKIGPVAGLAHERNVRFEAPVRGRFAGTPKPLEQIWERVDHVPARADDDREEAIPRGQNKKAMFPGDNAPGLGLAPALPCFQFVEADGMDVLTKFVAEYDVRHLQAPEKLRKRRL